MRIMALVMLLFILGCGSDDVDGASEDEILTSSTTGHGVTDTAYVVFRTKRADLSLGLSDVLERCKNGLDLYGNDAHRILLRFLEQNESDSLFIFHEKMHHRNEPGLPEFTDDQEKYFYIQMTDAFQWIAYDIILEGSFEIEARKNNDLEKPLLVIIESTKREDGYILVSIDQVGLVLNLTKKAVYYKKE